MINIIIIIIIPLDLIRNMKLIQTTKLNNYQLMARMNIKSFLSLLLLLLPPNLN